MKSPIKIFWDKEKKMVIRTEPPGFEGTLIIAKGVIFFPSGVDMTHNGLSVQWTIDDSEKMPE